MLRAALTAFALLAFTGCAHAKTSDRETRAAEAAVRVSCLSPPTP